MAWTPLGGWRAPISRRGLKQGGLTSHEPCTLVLIVPRQVQTPGQVGEWLGAPRVCVRQSWGPLLQHDLGQAAHLPGHHPAVGLLTFTRCFLEAS